VSEPPRIAPFIGGVAFALVVLVVAGRGHAARLRADAIAGWESQLASNAELTAAVVDWWLDERRTDAREAAVWSGEYEELFQPASHAVGTTRRMQAERQLLSTALTTLAQRQGYAGIWAIDTAGRVVAAADKSSDPTAEEIAEARAMRRARREIVLGPRLLGSGTARLSIVTPVPGNPGALIITLDPGRTLFPLVLRESGGSGTIRTKLIAHGTSSGHETYQVLNPSAYPASEPFGLVLPASVTPTLWKLGVAGIDTSGVFADVVGGRIVGAARHVGDLKWGVVRAIDEKEALVGARAQFRAEAAIALSLLVAITSTAAAAYYDAAKRRRIAARLAHSLSLLRATLESTADGILVVDGQGHMTSWNQRFVDMWRLPPGVLAERNDRGVLATMMTQLRDPDRFGVQVQELTTTPDAESAGALECSDGRVFDAHSRPQRTSSGAVIGRVWSFRDVTAHKALEAQLTHQAFHDPLTNLANRALFQDRVEHALARSDRSAEGVAVLFLDIDDFKRVNDSLGHGSGDRLLAAVAQRLVNATREGDTVARLGGDEFAVLLETLRDHAEALAVAERITAGLRAPVVLDSNDVVVGVSIGIARGGIGGGLARAAPELLRNADLAMYRAKAQGKGRYEVFEPEMHAAVLDRLALEGDLRHALEQNEFRLVYQPIVELTTGHVIGVEALVRWDHPRRGVVPPLSFIPLAEDTGLIVPLGRWILEEACRQAAVWNQRSENLSSDGDGPSVSVNISGRQLQHERFVDDVATVLRDSGLPPDRLVLEITEGVIMQETAVTLETLRALKALGVRLAIDDFGTGYSSLSYLQRFPVDILKIDKAFVDGVCRGGNDAALARTIIALGNMLHLHTVAEGIELAQQRSELRALGCDLGQGYLFARPLAAADVDGMLAYPARSISPA